MGSASPGTVSLTALWGQPAFSVSYRPRIDDDREKLACLLGLGGDVAFQTGQEPAISTSGAKGTFTAEYLLPLDAAM